jgi:NTP pyrophosphatase (non-canonical NTP hydrolase)
MTLEEYQKMSRKTARYPVVGSSFVYPTLGLCGESGELTEKVKKIFRDDDGKVTPEKRKEISKELGDVLWYLSQICTEFGLKLEDVADENIKKLYSRFDRDKISGSGDNR